MLERKLPVETVTAIISEAVEYEKEFVSDALPVSLIGMNSDNMCTYIEFVADSLLGDLGCPKIYNATNPFPWMDMISMRPKTNFFERKVGEYNKAGVDKSSEDTNISIPTSTDDIDF